MSSHDLKGKVALVTGSAAGLGLAILRAFAEEGCHCVLTDINEESMKQAEEQLKPVLSRHGTDLLSVKCDVSKEKSVEELYAKVNEKFGRVDIAVLNAGILRDGKLIRVDKNNGRLKSKMSLEQWQSVIDVNLTGVFLTGREAAAMMALGNGGVIIPISSIARHGNPGQTNYSAAKAGVAAMTTVWNGELSPSGIRVAAIAPGFIATEMVMQVMNQKALEYWKEQIPIGRLGNPQEIADTAVFIAKNELISGVVIEASGGVRI